MIYEKKASSFLVNIIIKKYKVAYLLMFIGPIFGSIYPILYNYSIKVVVDILTTVKYIQAQDVIYPMFLFIGGNIVGDMAWRVHTLGHLKIDPYLGRDIIHKVEDHLFGHSYSFFQNNQSGSLVSKVKGLSDAVFKLSEKITCGVSSHLMKILVAGFCLARVNYLIFFVILFFLIINIPISYFLYSKLAIKKKSASDTWHHLVGLIGDKLYNINLIFSSSTKKYEMNKTDIFYEEVFSPKIKKYIHWDLYSGFLLSVIYWIFLFALFALLIFLKNKEQVTTGDIPFVLGLSYVFTESLFYFLFEIKDLTSIYADLQSSYVILSEPHLQIDVQSAKSLQMFRGTLEIKNLYFAYNDRSPVISNLNLKINCGEKVGLVGSSGSGKSTLIALILKYFKYQQGLIALDDQDIGHLDSDSVRSQIAFIPQEPTMFHRSILENITYGLQNVPLEEVRRIAQLCKIDDDIMAMQSGYNSIIGERGAKISGGQKQRVAIVRAILKRSKILILDEATSALDTKTEQDVQCAIGGLLQETNAAILTIAHRLSTIKHMDKICVMSSGSIIEEGSFSDLISKNGKFKELWDHQVNGII